VSPPPVLPRFVDTVDTITKTVNQDWGEMDIDLKNSSSYGQLLAKLKHARARVNAKGAQWTILSAKRLDEIIRQHLAGQGRGGSPPPLSDMTKHIYQIAGEPDGSGIHNTLEQYSRQEGNTFIAGVGIPEGEQTMIAKVQDEGAVIPVTDKMRGFLAANFGIYLRVETSHIIIPGRNFWNESVKQAQSEAKKELARFMDELFNEA